MSPLRILSDPAAAFASSDSLQSAVALLPIDEVWSEWQRWAIECTVPSSGLKALLRADVVPLFPELFALIDVPQDPVWHPEGDVWIHTLHVCDAAACIADREELDRHERTVLLFAALCHDLGKATTTQLKEGRWRAHGHCEAGVPLTRCFLSRIGCPEEIIAVIEPLVAEHLVHAQKSIGKRTVRRLQERLRPASLTQLVALIEADMNGRPPLPGGLPPAVQEMVEMASEAACEPPAQDKADKPLVMGRHLIALGYQPGSTFRRYLELCLSAQLDGEFDTEAAGIEYLKRLLAADGGHGLQRSVASDAACHQSMPNC